MLSVPSVNSGVILRVKNNVSDIEVWATKLMALGTGGLSLDHDFRRERMT